MNDLYRIVPYDADQQGVDFCLARMLDTGVLVKVEPCVHGNYARHIVTYISSALGDVPHGEWCDGTPEATDE